MSRATQPTRILVVGGGGREHALAWKLAAEPGVNEVVVAPGSDAIAREPRVRRAVIDPLDAAAVVRVARERSVELAVVGPEGRTLESICIVEVCSPDYNPIDYN